MSVGASWSWNLGQLTKDRPLQVEVRVGPIQNWADNFFMALPFFDNSDTTSPKMLRPSLLCKVSVMALSQPKSSNLTLMARSTCPS